MTDLWPDLLGCLKLTSVSTEPDDRPVFTGPNQSLTYHRLFGGQLLGQIIESARAAVPDKAVRSLTVLFPRAGKNTEPVHYEVEELHRGGSFASLVIRARQSAGVIAAATVSMHAVEDGREHQEIAPVPPVPDESAAVQLDLIPWQARATSPLDLTGTAPATYELWLRTPSVDAELAPALTAYASDLTLIGTALRPLAGVTQRDTGTVFTSAVTSHSITFHRPFRTDEWLLLRQSAPILAHGRSYGRGDVLTADGRLVASYSQEALVRFA